MHEAKIEDTETGRLPADDGWFILNVREIGWETVAGGGTWCGFEQAGTRSAMLGIGVHVLPAGETPGFYHLESDQEGFLVLSGECLAIVEGEERRMGQWDYLHSPPGTAHITIGASEEPCAILMAGTRTPGHTTRYLAEPAAARHGAAVPVETDSPKEAYKDRGPITRTSAPWPPRIRLDQTVIGVSDRARSADFYARVLDARVSGDGRLRIGDVALELRAGAPGGAELRFLWDGGIDAAIEHLRAQGIEAERGAGTTVRFRDPDGNRLELIARR